MRGVSPHLTSVQEMTKPMLGQQVFRRLTQWSVPRLFLGNRESRSKNFHVPKEPISVAA